MNRYVYKSGSRQIVFKVFQGFMSEFQAGKLLSDLDDVYGRAAKATGVTQSTVRRIVDEGMQNGSVIKIEKEYYTRGGTLYNDIDKLVVPVGDSSSSSESEDEELDELHCAGPSGNISGVEYLDFDFD